MWGWRRHPGNSVALLLTPLLEEEHSVALLECEALGRTLKGRGSEDQNRLRERGPTAETVFHFLVS